MRPHERLEVWNSAVSFVITVYKATESFPKEEKFGLTSQIRRAAVSVPAKYCRGRGASIKKEFAHFLSNAQGSASELATELLIAHRLGYLKEEIYASMRDELDSIGRMVFGLSKYLRQESARSMTDLLSPII